MAITKVKSLKGEINIPVISLITDFAPHYTYIAEGIDHYIVSSVKMVAAFKTRFNIDSSRVHAFGIPTFEKFSTEPEDKGALMESLGLNSDEKVILFMAGSWGVTDVLDIYKDIADKTDNCQFVVITGNNFHSLIDFQFLYLQLNFFVIVLFLSIGLCQLDPHLSNLCKFLI